MGYNIQLLLAGLLIALTSDSIYCWPTYPAVTYYVTPTPNTPCPEEGAPCFTLSQYAAKPAEYFFSSTLLSLLPGTHSLDTNLQFQGSYNVPFGYNLTIAANKSTINDSDVFVTCSQSARFVIDSTTHVNIKGLVFLECMNNNITRVYSFTLEDCVFHGLGRRGSALLIYATSANISRSSFYSNSGSDVTLPRYGVVTGGGAIVVRQSYRLGITISNCTFANNTLGLSNQYSRGGAVFALNSVVVVNNSIIKNNCVPEHFYSQGCEGGGAVYAYRSTIAVNNSFFMNNIATKSGGAVYCEDAENITVVNSTFIDNVVRDGPGGGALYVAYGTLNITWSNFVDNFVNGYKGGAVSAWACRMTILSSTFTNNSVTTKRYALGGGAVYVESSTVTIISSTFANNVVIKGDSDETGLGKGGALYFSNINVDVHDTVFTNNTAIDRGGAVCAADASSFHVYNTTVTNNVVTGYRGRGGGLYIDTYLPYHPATLNNCTINSNAVIGDEGEGGAIYLESTNLTTSGYLDMQNNFANSSAVHAVGSDVHFSGCTTISKNHGPFILAVYSNVTFSGNTTITNNSLSYTTSQGGAVAGFQSVIVFIGTTNLMFNSAKHGGAIFVTESKLYLKGNLSVADNTATSSGGGIYAYLSELNFQGRINITRNGALESGGGIHAVSSSTRIISSSNTVVFDSRADQLLHSDIFWLTFSENSAVRGGGMCLELNSKLYVIKARKEWYYDPRSLNTWLKLNFTNNSADYGGAIYVTDDTNSGACIAIPFASEDAAIGECFFQVLAVYDEFEFSVLPQKNNIFNTNFANNLASIAGDTIYGGLLDRCTVSRLSEIFYKTKYIDLIPSASLSAQSYLLNTTNIEPKDFKRMISSDPVRLCFCRDNKPDCSYHPPAMHVGKGEMFKLSLVAVDQVNNTISNTSIHGSLSLQAELSGGQSIQNTNLNGTCTELEYSVQSLQDVERLLLYADGPCAGTGISARFVVVNFVPCPIGFVDTDKRCECDPYLYPEYISNCSIDTESVLRKDNVWFSFVNTTEHQDYVLHPECPFDYCNPPTEVVFVNLNLPHGADAQCAFNRSGKLCGSCKDGLSLSLGSSLCKPCSNNWLALIVLFAVAGIALVAFILMCNLTVAAGTINGLIFYTNVLAANRAIFIPFDRKYWITFFIAWFNLDFGFETCFFDGMDGYAKVWLQLAFPLYVIILVITIIVICDYSPRFAALFTGKDPIATLATLILLSYAKLIRTIIAVFSFAALEYTDGTRDLVWLYDANVPYLKGKHIPLFIAAIGILIFGVVYTFMVSLFFWQWVLQLVMKNSKRIARPSKGDGNITRSSRGIRKPFRWMFSNAKFNSFMDTYQAPYNKDHRYWVGLLLLVRVLLYLVSAVNVLGDPRINLLSINSVIVGLLFFQHMAAYRERIHKSLFTDVIENSFFFNLVGFASITLYITNDTESQARLAYASTGIAFGTFVVILAYHTYLYAKQLWKEALVPEEDNPNKDIIAKLLYRVWIFIHHAAKRRKEAEEQTGIEVQDEHQELIPSKSETETELDITSLIANYASWDDSTQDNV